MALASRGATPDPGLLAAAATGLIALAAVAIISGPGEIVAWVQRTIAFSSQQLVAYSVWGLGRQAFADSGVMTPVIDAPTLGTLVSWILAALLAGLVVIALRRPGTDSLAMWNVASAVVMLIPVSHLWYRLLMLPLIWVWVATALRRPRDAWAVSTAVFSVVFWWVTFRLQPIDNRFAESTGQYLVVMIVGVVMLALSVTAAARRSPMSAPGNPRRGALDGAAL